MDFIAFDFETANEHPHSACSIGLVVVRDGQIVDEYYRLIRPETNFCPRNIQVHGIRPIDVINAPKFPAVWQEIQGYFSSDQLVVAHNVPFDSKVLAGTLASYQLAIPRYQTLDTVRTSRQLLAGRVANCKLNTVAAYYRIPLNHHDAMDDARACAKILLAQVAEFGPARVNDFIRQPK